MLRTIPALVAAALCLLVPASAPAQPPGYRESGTIRLETTEVALGIGVEWGQGTLHYAGKDHPFSIHGLELLDVGVAKVSASGTVFNLDRLEDFAGTYVALEAGAGTVIGGGGLTMKNPKGVAITVKSEVQGIRLAVAAGGLTIELEPAAKAPGK